MAELRAKLNREFERKGVMSRYVAESPGRVVNVVDRLTGQRMRVDHMRKGELAFFVGGLIVDERERKGRVDRGEP
jgi:hypothetical protein